MSAWRPRRGGDRRGGRAVPPPLARALASPTQCAPSSAVHGHPSASCVTASGGQLQADRRHPRFATRPPLRSALRALPLPPRAAAAAEIERGTARPRMRREHVFLAQPAARAADRLGAPSSIADAARGARPAAPSSWRQRAKLPPAASPRPPPPLHCPARLPPCALASAAAATAAPDHGERAPQRWRPTDKFPPSCRSPHPTAAPPLMSPCPSSSCLASSAACRCGAVCV